MVELALPTVENIIQYAALAQLVEQGTENPCVLGSIPRRGIFFVFLHSDSGNFFD